MTKSPAPASSRRFQLPHTADTGFRAVAPGLPALFEEAARALADVTADIPAGTRPASWTPIELVAADLPGLAYGWLNQLIAEGEIGRATLAAVAVRAVEPAPGGGWRLAADVGFVSLGAPGVEVRRPPKSATYHRLEVTSTDGGWSMTAYLDV